MSLVRALYGERVRYIYCRGCPDSSVWRRSGGVRCDQDGNAHDQAMHKGSSEENSQNAQMCTAKVSEGGCLWNRKRNGRLWGPAELWRFEQQ